MPSRALPANSPALSTLMAPFSFSTSDIMTSGANQISASQARRSSNRSSHEITCVSSSAQSPLSATNVFDTPCQGERHPARHHTAT